MSVFARYFNRLLATIMVATLAQAGLGLFTKAAPPPDFQTTQIIGAGLDGPSGFEFAPDGRIFILERTGTIRVYKNGQLLPAPFAALPSVATGDRGLIGIAFDPDWIHNHYVYFYYTGEDLLNRLVRFDSSGDIGTNGPLILYQTSSPSNQLHVGGSIRFGPDGKLYFAVGDNGYPPNGQDLGNPHGKILRINKDGSAPADNPFVGRPGVLPEIWAYGFRNPWRFQFDARTGLLYGGDVGDFNIEEVNHIVRGGNYGWPVCEGPCSPANPSYINPIFSYPHDGESAAVTGGPIYYGSMFPAAYQGRYFFGDYAKGFIRTLGLDGAGNATDNADFDLNAGSVVDMKVAPDGSLYYVTYIPGRLYRVTYNTDNHVPIANASSDVTKGREPLTVRFSSAGSNDPDGTALTYQWDFGDGTTSTTANPVKNYPAKGTYTAVLTVSDGVNTAQAVPIVIQVGQPPAVTIGQPAEGSRYNAGDTINYTVSAVDGAGFDINDASLSTDVVLHHHTHIHPFIDRQIGRTGSFVIPDTGEAAADTWHEIKTTATDTSGLATTASVNIFPNQADLTIQTQPAGLGFYTDGVPQTSPVTMTGVVNFKRELAARPIQTDASGRVWQFDHWSDGGAVRHTIATPATNTTYTAVYTPAPSWNAQYWANPNLTGAARVTRQDPLIDFVWSDGPTVGSPDPSIPPAGFSARWTKSQFFAAGRYQFTTTTDDGVRLFVDGQPLIDEWHDQGTNTPHTSVIDLAEGQHELKVEYYQNGGGAIAKVTWETTPDQPGAPPPSAGGWQGEYWNTAGAGSAPAVPSRAPDLARTDPELNFNWGDGVPAPQIGADHFVARWTKTSQFAAGTYRFQVQADDGVRLYVDGVKILDKWVDQGGPTFMVERPMTAGQHTVVLEYYENGGGALAIMSYAQIDTTPPPPAPGGYAAQFWNTPGADSAPAIPTTPATLTRTDPEINFVWDNSPPAPQINADHFVARWTRTVSLEAASYHFETQSDDGVRVYVDNELVIDEWNDHGLTTHTADRTLSAGAHELRIEYYENGGGAIAKFNYAKVTGGNTGGWSAEYFDNQTLTGSPRLTRTDTAINFAWDNGSPDPAIPVDHFSARWTKTQPYEAGSYTFTLKSDDGIKFYVDGQLKLDHWDDHALATDTVTVPLSAGLHTLRIEYYENGGGAVAVVTQN